MSILQDESTVATDGSSSQSSPPKIDLQTCQPDELAAWLLAHRFKDNAMDVASFLLNCTSTLPNAEEISAQLLGGGGEVDDDDEEEMEEDESKADDAEDAKPSPAQPAPAAKPKNNADPQTNLLQSILNSQPNPTFATSTEIEVSCINPRGKFILSIHKNGMVFTNPKKRDEEQIPISSANVQSVLWFRKPEDYRKVTQIKKNAESGKKSKQGVPGHMVLICLKEDEGGDDDAANDNIVEVKFRNKPLKQVCFQLPSYPIDESNDQLTEEAWWNGLSSALYPEEAANGAIIRVHATLDKADYLKGKAGGYMFKSEGESGSTSTTTGGMPFVGCYQGFNDGALFPLREGLLFFKPPMFVPRSKLASISCGRGSGGSRYVDMVVQLDVSGDEQEGKKKKKQSDMFEFTNIHRDELNGLNDYIHKTLIPAMQMDADGTGNVAEANSGSDDSASDDDEEAVAEVVDGDNEDQNTNDSDDEEPENGKRRRRPSRAASKSAREITRAALKAPVAEEDDDSDDDSDAFEEGDGSDDSDDESLDSDESSEDEEFDEEKMNESDDEDSGEDTGAQKSKKARVE